MIAQTQNSNSRRITKDLQNSAMKDHMRNIHRNILTSPKIIKNVSCIKKFDNVKKQKIYEVLIILKAKSSVNGQNEDF